MCLLVHGRRGLLAGRVHQAEHRTRAFVEPVFEVLDPVLRLNFQVSLVGAGDGISGETVDLVMVIHVQRHVGYLLTRDLVRERLHPRWRESTSSERQAESTVWSIYR